MTNPTDWTNIWAICGASHAPEDLRTQKEARIMRKTKEMEKPEVKAETKAVETKAAEVKAPETKAETKVEAKAAKPVKAARPAKKAEEKTELVMIQFGGQEWDSAALVAKAKADYEAQGHRASGIKSFSLYVKPEEGKAYYVVNDTDTGSVAL